MSKLLEALRGGVLLGDGAIGTLLYQRGQPLNGCYDALNLSAPEVIRQVHRDYLAAGARLLETNTFGANRLKLAKAGLESKLADINRRGAELAVEIARPAGAFVAGSIGPLFPLPAELPPENERATLYGEQVDSLVAGGVDAIFIETFSRLDALLLAVRAARERTDLPILASLSFGDDGHTADRYRINEAFGRLREAGADVTGLNCHVGPTQAENFLQELSVQEGDLVSVYPNAGRPRFFEGRYIYHPTPQYFADFAARLVAQGARLLGGCCGTTPETIAAMGQAMRGLQPVARKVGRLPERTRIESLELPADDEPSTPADETLLDRVARGTVIVTELDPPKSLELGKMIQGARELRAAGTDYVTMADNSLAVLRVSNVATGVLIRDRTGAEPIIHMACRDRNLLGLQSELMGLHALGIHHVLALTGDPAKVGDHPGASSVYDVNSIGLIETIRRMNEGYAANGRDLKSRTRFVIGCAFNPNSRNIDSQVRKLEDKIKAGAQFVMTQPIFDPALAKITHEKTRHCGIPVFVGVMPLLNARNTEFLHNEVPGIVIPDVIRERMRGKEGPDGNSEGLKVSRELCDEVLNYFRAIYLITPLMRFDLTVALSCHVRQSAKS